MNTYDTYDVSICIDCAVLAANGELPDTDRDTGNPADWSPLDRVDDDTTVVVLDGESFFSWSWCDTCTSHLGGDRLPAALLTKEPTS